MSNPCIAIVVGTRPEFIKMVPLYLSMRERKDITVRLVVTAQHRHLLDQLLSVFQITPDIDLNLMTPNQTLTGLASRILTKTGEVFAELHPDAVLVHGDTSTCFYGALAAFYAGIPVGHVEAGLRTYDLQAPWPEEMNRRLTDPISRWCFAPTSRAAENLHREGIDPVHIAITGNTAVDALCLAQQMVQQENPVIDEVPDSAFDGRRLILVTGHRRESFGKPLEQVCYGLRDVVEEHPDTVLIYPVHLNPNIQDTVKTVLSGHQRIYLIEPVDYLRFVALMKRSYLIITDSGGIQEEAPTLQKPVLVTRRSTERPEALEAGCAKLVGCDRKNILSAASELLSNEQAYARMQVAKNPFGDGQASERIVQRLLTDI